MIKNIIIVFALLLASSASAQDYVREQDRNTSKPILRGKMTFDNLLKETTLSWLAEDAEAYEPNRMAVEELSNVWQNYRFVVFIGTWCEDTRNLLPKFYKTFLEANIGKAAIEIYGVNRAKQSLQEEHKYYKITHVPTIIVMHQKREVGRIVENVNSSVEEELAAIMSKDAKELEIKKAEDQIRADEMHQAEIKSLNYRQRKRYYAPRSFY